MNIVFMSMDTLPSTLWARDLYDQMHIRSDFRKWFPRMCQYGFIEGRDYEYRFHFFLRSWHGFSFPKSIILFSRQCVCTPAVTCCGRPPMGKIM